VSNTAAEPPATEELPIPFLDALRGKLQERRADGANLAVLLIDCGVISRIDAIWGYHVGDAVRGRINASLRADVLRPGDLVGELGRDDFAFVLSTIEGPGVAFLAAKKSLRAMNAPFWIGDEEISASPAIGIAMCPAHGDQAEALLQRAKSASTLARDLPGRIAEYEEAQENPAGSKLLYENRLRAAVAEDALGLLFQPQYDLRLGQVMGAESLLCWSDPSLGMVSSSEAFAAAESAGIVPDLLSSILNRALRNISELRYSAGLDLRIGVKLPARALLHVDLPDIVERALGTWGRRAGSLILEISEVSVLCEEEVARETVVKLKALGVKLSIDDPDLALSSLFRLATLPFQEIKIDVSSSRDIAGEEKAERILQSIIELAHYLRFAVVAVGVPDDASAARLKELRCDFMQADYKGPAVDPKGFVERFGFSED
jgi:diguanylate cyclase (GGDEF)-like protein